VLQPLAEAEGYLFFNGLERGRACLDEAAGAIVGLPFLELDWRIEFLRALLSERQGDREGSRRFLHRSLHTQDLLARLVPAGHRQTFLSHDRFLPLAELTSRSEKPSLLKPSTSTGAAPQGFAGILGRSSAMQRVFRTLEKLRDQEIPVVITGETGTGKELVARAIHETSPRRNGRFLALHCASLPPELFESELFGYAAGAFTGAEDSHEGLLEHLARGTLLFDEVTSLSPLTQAKLLRVLDARTVRPLGSSSPRPVDVRFLASSSLDLAEAVKAKTFRADLYFRLRGAEIHLPPLRARADDIPLLAQHYLQLHAKRLGRSPLFFTTEALDFLQGHGWPGNVRELETVLVRLLVTSSPRAAIGVEALRPLLPRQEEDSLFSDDLLAGRDIKDLKRNLERAYLRRLFKETGGDIEKMSENLAMKRVSLYLWFRRIGMDVHALRREL